MVDEQNKMADEQCRWLKLKKNGNRLIKMVGE